MICEGQHSDVLFATLDELRTREHIFNRTISQLKHLCVKISEAIARVFALQNSQGPIEVCWADQQIDIAVRPKRLLWITARNRPSFHDNRFNTRVAEEPK